MKSPFGLRLARRRAIPLAELGRATELTPSAASRLVREREFTVCGESLQAG